MKTSILKAISLIMSGDAELINILSVTCAIVGVAHRHLAWLQQISWQVSVADCQSYIDGNATCGVWPDFLYAFLRCRPFPASEAFVYGGYYGHCANCFDYPDCYWKYGNLCFHRIASHPANSKRAGIWAYENFPAFV